MNVNNIIKILIADDHKLFRAGIIKMLSDYPDFSVIAEAENGEVLYEKYFETKPDVTLVDISMPVLSGMDAVKKIRIADNKAKILFLSMYDSEEFIYSCSIIGAMGLVNKNVMESELVYAIRSVYNGEKYFGKDIDEDKLLSILLKYESIYLTDSNPTINSFTKREIEILKLIGSGDTSADIAEKLFISIKTVDTHRAHMAHKLKLKSLPELLKFAIQYNSKENN